MQLKGIADADFVGLASANRGSAMHRLLAQWAKFSRGLSRFALTDFMAFGARAFATPGKSFKMRSLRCRSYEASQMVTAPRQHDYFQAITAKSGRAAGHPRIRALTPGGLGEQPARPGIAGRDAIAPDTLARRSEVRQEHRLPST